MHSMDWGKEACRLPPTVDGLPRILPPTRDLHMNRKQHRAAPSIFLALALASVLLAGGLRGRPTRAGTATTSVGYSFGADGQLYQIDLATGEAIPVGTVGFAVDSLAFGSDGTLFGIDATRN